MSSFFKATLCGLLFAIPMVGVGAGQSLKWTPHRPTLIPQGGKVDSFADGFQALDADRDQALDTAWSKWESINLPRPEPACFLDDGICDTAASSPIPDWYFHAQDFLDRGVIFVNGWLPILARNVDREAVNPIAHQSIVNRNPFMPVSFAIPSSALESNENSYNGYWDYYEACERWGVEFNNPCKPGIRLPNSAAVSRSVFAQHISNRVLNEGIYCATGAMECALERISELLQWVTVEFTSKIDRALYEWDGIQFLALESPEFAALTITASEFEGEPLNAAEMALRLKTLAEVMPNQVLQWRRNFFLRLGIASAKVEEFVFRPNRPVKGNAGNMSFGPTIFVWEHLTKTVFIVPVSENSIVDTSSKIDRETRPALRDFARESLDYWRCVIEQRWDESADWMADILGVSWNSSDCGGLDCNWE